VTSLGKGEWCDPSEGQAAGYGKKGEWCDPSGGQAAGYGKKGNETNILNEENYFLPEQI
jgi:hypothetical protein